MGEIVDFPFVARLVRAIIIEPVEVAPSANQDVCRAVLWGFPNGRAGIPGLRGSLHDVMRKARLAGDGLPVLVTVKARRRARK